MLLRVTSLPSANMVQIAGHKRKVSRRGLDSLEYASQTGGIGSKVAVLPQRCPSTWG